MLEKVALKTAEERRRIFKLNSKFKSRENILETNGVKYERGELRSIQENLDNIDEKIYTIRKRIDVTSELFEKVREEQRDIENKANEIMKTYNEFLALKR